MSGHGGEAALRLDIHHLAEVAHDQGNDERATALLEESLTLFRDIGHQYGPALHSASWGQWRTSRVTTSGR